MKPLRIAFEHYWVKTRSKKARNDLQRHPAQPETYISDSANRHWVTWQAATAPQQRKPLTDARLDDIYYCVEGGSNSLETWREQARAIEAAHGIKE